MNSRHSSK